MGLISIQVRLHKNAESTEVQAVLGESDDGGYALYATPKGEDDRNEYPFRAARPYVHVIYPRGDKQPYTEVYWVFSSTLTREDVARISNNAYQDQKWGLSADAMELLHNNPAPSPLTREELVRLAAEASAAMPHPIIESMATSMDLSEREVEELFDRVEAEWEEIKAGLGEPLEQDN